MSELESDWRMIVYLKNAEALTFNGWKKTEFTENYVKIITSEREYIIPYSSILYISKMIKR